MERRSARLPCESDPQPRRHKMTSALSNTVREHLFTGKRSNSNACGQPVASSVATPAPLNAKPTLRWPTSTIEHGFLLAIPAAATKKPGRVMRPSTATIHRARRVVMRGRRRRMLDSVSGRAVIRSPTRRCSRSLRRRGIRNGDHPSSSSTSKKPARLGKASHRLPRGK